MARGNSARLTDPGIERMRAAPKGKYADRYDALAPGLYIRTNDKGRKAWFLASRTNDGRQHRFLIGEFPHMGVANARMKAQDWRAKMRRGINPRDEERQAATDTFTAAWEEYRQRRVMGLRTARDVVRIFEKEVLPYWSRSTLRNIAKTDVIRLIDRIEERGPVMAGHVLAHLRAFFNWHVGRGAIGADPTMGLKRNVAKARDRFLSDDELADVWGAAESMGAPYGPLVQLLVLTGARREEAAGMRWSEIDMAAARWVIPGERMKNGKPHSVPLTPQALAILKALPRYQWKGEPSDLVLTHSGSKPIAGFSKLKRQLDEATKKARQEAMPGWVLHDLRRTVASGIARLGFPVTVAEKVLSHTSGSLAGVAGVYQRHDFENEKRAALEAWARHVDAVLIGK